MGEGRAQETGSTDRLGSSEARWFLSRLSGAISADGVLMVQKSNPGPEGADLAPGSALRWPRCECGSPKCPDYQARPQAAREELSARVAEANERSRRGGL
jgi:hypothetical protein